MTLIYSIKPYIPQIENMGYIWLDVTVLANILSAGFCSNWKTNKKAIQHSHSWIIYYILIACVQTSPLPQEKSGQETSIYSVLNTEPVIKANKLYKTMQIVELGEAIRAYDIIKLYGVVPIEKRQL